MLWTTTRVRLRAAARGRGDRVVDDAAEAEPRRRRARARQGRHGDRPAHRAARDRQGPAARLRPRPAGGQAAGVRARGATSRARSARSTVLVAGSRSTATGSPPRAPTRCCARPTRPRRSSREGVPFRDAHEQVAGVGPRRHVRAAAPPAPRLGDVAAAVDGGEGAVVVMSSPLPVDARGPRPAADRPTSSPAEIEAILDLADELKATPRQPLLPGRTLGLFFGKPSTRTRVSFSVAMAQLGGTRDHARARARCSSRAASRCDDTAQVLSRYVDALAIRTLAHDELEAWAEACDDPGDQRAHRRASIRARRSPTR